MRRTWRTPIPRSHIRTPALLAARVVGRSTYAGTSAVTINHRQVAGRLRKASCAASGDQLAPSGHSLAQALVGRNIHRSFPARTAVAPKRLLFGIRKRASGNSSQHEISDDVFPVKRFKFARRKFV